MSGRLSHSTNNNNSPDRRYYQGYVYLKGTRNSEQPPVIKVTSKLGRAKNLSQTNLAENELFGLIHIYVRLYLCPPVTRKRLHLWRKSHKEVIANWRPTDFWNTIEQDQMLRDDPRPPGIPPGATRVQPRAPQNYALSDSVGDDLDNVGDTGNGLGTYYGGGGGDDMDISEQTLGDDYSQVRGQGQGRGSTRAWNGGGRVPNQDPAQGEDVARRHPTPFRDLFWYPAQPPASETGRSSGGLFVTPHPKTSLLPALARDAASVARESTAPQHNRNTSSRAPSLAPSAHRMSPPPRCVDRAESIRSSASPAPSMFTRSTRSFSGSIRQPQPQHQTGAWGQPLPGREHRESSVSSFADPLRPATPVPAGTPRLRTQQLLSTGSELFGGAQLQQPGSAAGQGWHVPGLAPPGTPAAQPLRAKTEGQDIRGGLRAARESIMASYSNFERWVAEANWGPERDDLLQSAWRLSRELERALRAVEKSV